MDAPVTDVQSAVEQEDAILRWAARTGNRVVTIVPDEGEFAADDLASRVGLAETLDILDDGRAKGLVVGRLDRLSSDAIRQEQLIAEIGRRGPVFSASADDAPVLDGQDPDRLLIRQVLASVPGFQGALRSLRIRYRLGKAPMSGDVAQAALSRIEHLSEGGASLREISRSLTAEGFSPRYSHIWDRGGLMRIVARLGVSRPRSRS